MSIPHRLQPLTGTEFAGEVEAVGGGVSSLKAGDRVFGFDDNGARSHAQYLAIREHYVVTIPGDASFEQAAASSEGAHYAYSCIQKLNLDSGHKALVYGATGAIGSAAVQLLKSSEVNVTAVGTTKNMEMMKSLVFRYGQVTAIVRMGASPGVSK